MLLVRYGEGEDTKSPFEKTKFPLAKFPHTFMSNATGRTWESIVIVEVVDALVPEVL